MIRINLLPVRAAQKKERLRSQATILGLSVFGTIAICVLVFMTLSGKIDEAQAKIQQQNAEIAQLKVKIKDVENIKQLKEQLQAKLDVLAQLKANRTGPGRLLEELSRVIPEKIWISSFKESAGSITMTGAGLTQDSVAQFMSNLEESKFFKDVVLGAIDQKASGDREIQSFELRCLIETTK